MSRPDALTFKFGQPLFAAAWPSTSLLLVAGGGGKPGSGIENRIIAATYANGVLSDEVSSVRLKSACEKIAVSRHSNLVLAVTERAVVPYTLVIREGAVQFIMPQTSIVDAFSALTDRITAIKYSRDGRLLVLGSASGTLHVFQASRCKHISSHRLRSRSEEPESSEIKDLDIYSTADDPTSVQLCISADSGDGHMATLKVNSVNSAPVSTELVSCVQLPKPKKIQNGSMKHIRFAGGDIVASINYRGTGHVCRWQALQGGLHKQQALSAPMDASITGMDISSSGVLLGITNAEGHTLLLHSESLKVIARNKKAHMVFGTDVAFSRDSRAYLSVSGDASARVNLVPEARSRIGQLIWLLALLLIAMAVLLVFHDLGLLEGELEVRVGQLGLALREQALRFGQLAKRCVSVVGEKIDSK